MKYVLAMIVAGLVLLTYGCAKADWQVHEWTGTKWEPARTPRGLVAKPNVEETACLLDLVSLSLFKADGTRLQCRRIPRPEPEPSR